MTWSLRPSCDLDQGQLTHRCSAIVSHRGSSSADAPPLCSNLTMSVFRMARSVFVVALCARSLCADSDAITPRVLQLPQIYDFVWDATRSRLLVSAGSTIIMVNPETAEIEETIASGLTASRIAISDDGQFLYAAIPSRGVVDRYRLQTHGKDIEIPLGQDSQGRPLTATSIVVLPGQPQSILVARGWYNPTNPSTIPTNQSQDLAIFDGAVQRSGTLSLNVASLHTRPSDGSVYGFGCDAAGVICGSATGFYRGERVYRFSVNAGAITVDRSSVAPVSTGSAGNTLPLWGGSLLVDRSGTVFDFDAGNLIGRAPVGRGCALAIDPSGTSVVGAIGGLSTPSPPVSLVQYSLDTFRATASVGLDGTRIFPAVCGGGQTDSLIRTWGTDGIAASVSINGTPAIPGLTDGGPWQLVLLHVTGLKPVAPLPPPSPSIDASGVIRLPVPANSFIFDSSRSLLWATVPGSADGIGNSVVSIDPASGRIVDTIPAGSEPGKLAISTDGSRLFTILQSALAIGTIDLNGKRRTQAFSVSDANQWTPVSLAVLPDQNSSVAVVRIPSGGLYSSNITVYDSGIPRPKSFSNFKAGT